MRGATEFNPATGQTKIPIEMLSMNLTGNSPLGPVTVRAGRELGFEPSIGEIDPHSTASDLPGRQLLRRVRPRPDPLDATCTPSRPFHVQTTVHGFPALRQRVPGERAGPAPRFERNTGGRDQQRPASSAVRSAQRLRRSQRLHDRFVQHALRELPARGGAGCGRGRRLRSAGQLHQRGERGAGTLVFPVYPEMIKFTTKTQFCWTTPARGSRRLRSR